MKKSLLIIFLLLIAVPISVMTWLGYSGYRREIATVSERYSILARKQLEEIDRLIVSHIGHIEGSLYFEGRTLDAEEMRNAARARSRSSNNIQGQRRFLRRGGGGTMLAVWSGMGSSTSMSQLNEVVPQPMMQGPWSVGMTWRKSSLLGSRDSRNSFWMV